MNVMSKPWSDEYLQEAIADEIALAAAHPLFRRRVTMPSVLTISVDLYPDPPKSINSFNRHFRTTPTWPLPHWRRDWRAAGVLVGELGLSIRPDEEEGTVSVGTGSRRRDVTEAYADHPDKDAAIRAAIVRAAIRFCTESREGC